MTTQSTGTPSHTEPRKRGKVELAAAQLAGPDEGQYRPAVRAMANLLWEAQYADDISGAGSSSTRPQAAPSTPQTATATILDALSGRGAKMPSPTPKRRTRAA